MNEDCLKLTVYFGEHQRVGRELLSDALLDVYHRHQLEAAVLLRGTEGFGLGHTLHTQRLLSLSEDLPLVSVGVDAREKIERVLPEITEIVGKGLVTIERARMLSGQFGRLELPDDLGDAVKLTIYCGRAERRGDRPAYQAAIQLLHDHGVAGATAFLGVDGMRHGIRHRARFFSRNDNVPLLVVSVGDGAIIARLLPQIAELLTQPLLTLERVRVCKRDGELLCQPGEVPAADDAGREIWQKLTVYVGEQAQYQRHSLYIALIRRLRAEGAAGATALRGIWGYSDDRPPHGETLLSLGRTVPVVIVLVDRPERMQRWWQIVDELTDEAGLVTSELVPAVRAVGPEGSSGGLDLASGWS